MTAERLRDTNENWGLSLVENAHREKKKLRDRMRLRAQRARVKEESRAVVPVDNVLKIMPVFRLKALDIQELGILAYRKYVPNRTGLGIAMTAKGEGDWISLPFVSILAGAAP